MMFESTERKRLFTIPLKTLIDSAHLTEFIFIERYSGQSVHRHTINGSAKTENISSCVQQWAKTIQHYTNLFKKIINVILTIFNDQLH